MGTGSGIGGPSPRGGQERMSKEMGPREEMAGQPQLSQGRLQVEGRDGSSCIGHLHLVNVTAVVSQQRGGGYC